LTTFNCVSAGYPFEAALRSLGFAFEVVVVDGGSSDGTWERLGRVADNDSRVRLLRHPVDLDGPSWALDLELWLKAKARAACRGEVCWQADADEVVCEDDWRKIGYCTEELSEDTPLLAVPMLEYWGGTRLVRRDLYPATAKLSLNSPRITHGLPRGFRAHDEHGWLYALPYASLGPSYLDLDTLEPVACDSLIPDAVESLRQSHDSACYEAEFYDTIDDLPVVHHFAWVAIERKLFQLRNSWARFHASFHRSAEAVSAWPLFDCDWQDVSDVDIRRRARELRREGPGSLSGETDFPTLMRAMKELPLDAGNWLPDLTKPVEIVRPSATVCEV